MKVSRKSKKLTVVAVLMLLSFCVSTANAKHYLLKADKDFETKLIAHLSTVKPGDVLELPAGRFLLTRELVLVVQGVEIKGQGSDKTVLDFTKQRQGAQGFLARANNIKLHDFALLNPTGDGLVVRGAKRVAIDNIDIRWDAPDVKRAGGYGIYPVLSKDVRVTNCKVSGAAEAGIYIGQSYEGEISNNSVSDNSVGIDVENSTEILVANNATTNNSVGIVVSYRPHLQRKSSNKITVESNDIAENNRANKAPSHSLLSKLGQGMGIVVVASDDISLSKNRFRLNNASNISVISYETTKHGTMDDPLYDQYVERVRIFDNLFVHEKSQPNEASPGVTWRDAGFVDVQWDGLIKKIRKRVVDVVCLRQEREIYYLNRSHANAQVDLIKLDRQTDKCNL